MSALVTVERYRVITGDTTTAASAASAAIEDATDLLADALGRPGALKSAERTETMHVGDGGQLRPLAVPVTVCADLEHDTAQMYGASPDTTAFRGYFGDDLPRTVDVTYTGGWVERTANAGAVNALPAAMEQDIARAAYHLTHPTIGSVPVGAQSVSLGDASVSYGASGAPSGADVAWSRGSMKWKRRLP